MADREKELKEKEMLEARSVAIMAGGEGWSFVKNFIESNVKSLEKRLFDDELEKDEFDRLREKRKAYKSVLDFVTRRVEKTQKQ